jgi:hypothetical protein
LIQLNGYYYPLQFGKKEKHKQMGIFEFLKWVIIECDIADSKAGLGGDEDG